MNCKKDTFDPNKKNPPKQLPCKTHSNSKKSNRSEVVDLEGKEFYVHELVAKAFIPNPDNLPYVEHIDGDRLNNCAVNLRWTAIKPEGYKPL
jgi:hypothetical protein